MKIVSVCMKLAESSFLLYRLEVFYLGGYNIDSDGLLQSEACDQQFEGSAFRAEGEV